MNSPNLCSTSDLLHPQLMDTASIIEHLKHRQLLIPNIEQLSREEILRIYHCYAMPLHKRLVRTKNGNCQMDTSSPMSFDNRDNAEKKRKQIRCDTNQTDKYTNGSFNSMDLVTNDCKIIKISSSLCDNKRGLQETKVDTSISQKPKRQKITWP